MLGYALTITGGGLNATEQLAGDATSYALVGAANGVPYTFSLVATNARGTSPAATASASAFGVPGSVSHLAVAGSQTSSPPGQATAQVSWRAADPNGSPITTYRLTYNGVSVDAGDVTSATIGGLPGGRDVAVGVQACNVAGCGQAVAATSSPTPLTVPSQAQAVDVRVSAVTAGLVSEVTVAWQAPGDWGQGAAGDYVVTLTAGGQEVGTVTVSGTSATFSVAGSVTKGKDAVTFTAVVTARSEVGPGAAGTGEVTWRATSPDQVQGLVANASGSSADVVLDAGWQAVGGDVDHYEVEAQDGGGPWTLLAKPQVARLDPTHLGSIGTGTTLGVRVRAVSSAGLAGTWATTSVNTP
ncbi:MAG: fibronectin type III domain-containing protein [Actinobacteria bacterium]|nr:fibronectin type III domain-containing protein [Actinomycetota bacterium]MCG2801151.1 fibronectin type III domain-containing protein [Cellulomonas sp.]